MRDVDAATHMAYFRTTKEDFDSKFYNMCELGSFIQEPISIQLAQRKG